MAGPPLAIVGGSVGKNNERWLVPRVAWFVSEQKTADKYHANIALSAFVNALKPLLEMATFMCPFTIATASSCALSEFARSKTSRNGAGFHAPVIRFFLLQNRQGKTRLSKWYVPPPEDQEKARLEAEIHRLVVARDAKHTNFIEFRNYKLIYRRYAGLFFILGVDLAANELLGLETIHLFVELLDQQFANVCELDIVFNFNKVYSMLDEYILGGEVQETSKREMLDRIRELEKLE